MEQRNQLWAEESVRQLDTVHMAAAGCVSKDGGRAMTNYRKELMAQAGKKKSAPGAGLRIHMSKKVPINPVGVAHPTGKRK